MEVKLIIFVYISVHILSRSSAQRCTNEGRQVLNSCLEVCYCINGRIQNCCRVRKHFTSMTEAERTRYVETVRRVTTESAYRQEYRRIINMHQRLFSTGIHQKDQFLPWHRWYLLRYENLLRQVDCRVTLAYWDWSLFFMSPWKNTSDRIWYPGPSGLGGNGSDGSSGGYVTDGPFSRNVWRKTNGQCLRRRFSGLPPDIIAVYITQYFQPTDDGFTRFELNLRVNLHDTVHCRVGGDMCRMTSANAPEFFLHHAFIDKILANWQEYSHQHMIAHFSNLSFVMTGTRWYRPRDFINTHYLPDIQIPQNTDGRRICVSYEDPTRWEYNEIMRRLKDMTLQEILQIPRHSFAPVNNRQMRFFRVNRRERRQARRDLRRLEPRNELQGIAGLTSPIALNTGFNLESFPTPNRDKGSRLTKENSRHDMWKVKKDHS